MLRRPRSARPRRDPRRGRRADAGRQHQPRGAGCRWATSRPGTAYRPGRASTSSCSAPTASPTSADRCRSSIVDPDRRGGPRRHPPGHRRLRHGQLQRPPDGAARRPGRRLLLLRRHLRGGRAALRRRAHQPLVPVADEARTQVAFDPERRHVVPPRRLREPGDGRRRTSRTSASTPASSAPGTTPPRSTRCGWPRGSSRAPRSAPAEVRWTTPGSDEPAAASAQLYAADPEAPMSDSLAARRPPSRTWPRWSRATAYDEARRSSLDDVRNRAIALAAARRAGRGRAGRAGAERLELLQ